jgi:hypothetical protein
LLWIASPIAAHRITYRLPLSEAFDYVWDGNRGWEGAS